jgi:hypothetical protein
MGESYIRHLFGASGGSEYNPLLMNAARRTLGRWVLAALLERGCDPTTARIPRRVFSVRPLDARELAALHPRAWPLVPVSNLLPLPRPVRRPVYEV